MNSFYNYLQFEKRYSPHTLEAYRSDLSQFTDFLNVTYSTQDLTSVKPIHIRSWIVDLHEKQNSNRSINRKISALKTLYNFLRRRHQLEQNPLRKVINPKVEKRLPLSVKKEGIQNMLISELSSTNDEPWMRFQKKLILEILYTCGLRRSELINLEVNDLDISRKLIRVEGKGKKERHLPIHNELIEKIKVHLQNNKDVTASTNKIFMTEKGEPLYPKWVYNLVRSQLSLVTSIERKSPHILRHSFATHLSDAGADLNAIKTLLGHASLAATQVYMHNSIEKLKKIYEQAHPKS